MQGIEDSSEEVGKGCNGTGERREGADQAQAGVGLVGLAYAKSYSLPMPFAPTRGFLDLCCNFTGTDLNSTIGQLGKGTNSPLLQGDHQCAAKQCWIQHWLCDLAMTVLDRIGLPQVRFM